MKGARHPVCPGPIRALDLSDAPELYGVLDLQAASYAVEAALIGARDIPPLHDMPRTLPNRGETFYGYFLGRELVGAISHKTVDGVMDIHRLVVSPDYFRKRIARCLVTHVGATGLAADRIVVSTGADNVPATNLYLNLGFRRVAGYEAAPGPRVASFEKAGDGHEETADGFRKADDRR